MRGIGDYTAATANPFDPREVEVVKPGLKVVWFERGKVRIRFDNKI